MRFLALALLAALIACAPANNKFYPVPDYAKPFAKITLQGPDSLDTIAVLATALDEGKGGFVAKGFNEERTAVATSWLKVAGQVARVYFVVDDVKTGDAVTGSTIVVLTEPSPPPTPNLLARSLIEVIENVVDRFKGKVTKFNIEAAQ